MKKALITILVLGILGAGGYGVYHHFFADTQIESGRVSSSSTDAVYVDSVSAITGYGSGNGLIDRYGGEIEPQATLEVKLDSDKKVEECFVKEGDEVKEGQRLFVYDTQEDEDSLALAEIELERMENDIEVSQKQIEQLEKEMKSAGSDDQLTYRTEIQTLETSIKKYEYEIEVKKLEMEKLKESINSSVVTADMAGVVQKISDTDSSSSSYYGNSSDSAYITILAAGDFRVKGSANEQAINQGLIYEGMPVIVYSRVDNALTWTGVISEINTDNKEEESSDSMYYYYGSSSSGSSSYAFYVELDSSDGLILGQHVYMEENVGQNEQKDGMWLEEYYIVTENEQSYVWKASTANVLEKQEVVLGEYDDEAMEYEILEGLDADDYIAYPMESMTEGIPVIYNDYSTGEDLYLEEDFNLDLGDEFYDEFDMDDDVDMGAEIFEIDDEFSEEGVYVDDMYREDGGYSDDMMDDAVDLDEEMMDDSMYPDEVTIG